MDPPPPKQKLSVRKTLRKAVSVFRRSPSPSGSQKPSGEPSTKSRPPSPLPSNESHRPGPSSHDLQTPALVTSTPTPTPLNDEPPTIVITPVHTIPPDTAGEQPSSEANSAWAGLGTALRSLQKSVGAVPPLQSAVGSFLSCLDILEEAAANRKDYDELASELVSLSQILAQHMSQSSSKQMSKSIINITRLIEEQGNFINSKRSRGKGARIMESSEDRQDIDRSYRRIGSLFRQLQADVQLSIWSIMNTQMANTRLKELDPVKLANYDSNVSTNISRRSCTANTRTMVLHELDDWSYSPDAADVYWMNGMAGTGKTTIAYSFSELLEKRKQLAASFFCTRSIPQCQDVSRIIPTIAYQLARYSLPFQSALCEVLAEDPDASSKNMSRQFEQLLKTPLAKVQEAMPNNLVVVIDALDECGDVCSVEQFLMILLKSATDVPLRFFITSRPEPEIHSRMRTRGADTGDTLLLHEVEKSLVQADIETYLEEELKFMSPTPAEINELVRRSGNLFIYAATIVRSIITRRSQIDPHRRLRAMLSGSQDSTKQYASIDQLYATILGDALEKHSDYMQVEEIEEVHRVLRTALCVREPVHITTLAILAGLTDEGHAMDALQPLRAVINLTESTRLVSTLHVSFLDFMFDKTRSKAFYCDPGEQNIFLAQRCFEVMKAQLRFNICSLESSFVPDSAVAELKDRAKERISSELIYTCQYWADHLRQAVYSEPLGVVLEDFIRTRLLFWMEVLNLKELISLGGGILLQAILWLLTGATPAGLQTLVEDAQNIVMGFAVGPMSQCTPHIYLSLFSFCPRSNSVYENYRGKIQGSLNPEGTLIQKRNDDALSSWNIGAPIYSVAYSLDSSMLAFVYYPSFVCIRSVHDGKLVSGPFTGHKFLVNAVAYSPDGTRIASGSDDKTIRIWGVYNDAAAAGPFVGHTGAVLTVVYSPDSTHIASGSADETIRVWRVDSGLLVTEPFEGHTNMVHSIAYSPDGTRIVSGSSDRTVRVWNARDGTLVVGPFEGHSGMVTSIACSPDGTQIASGSADQTIRLWNSESGTLVAGPMEGHEALISSVAYSPNSTRLVSGAHDRMLRVWSAQTGKPVAGPLQGHTEAVMVVAYSPDGTRIVSGSDDRTIRFWGAYNSTYDPIPPPEGHSESVESVAYSPDATCIISSSHDKTIRVWSAHSGELVAGPLRGHTGPIDSVTYSPDGEHIASGSWDNTVRVWSSHDGKAVLDPLQGHTGAVYSVVYSPDGTRIVSGSMDCTIRVWNAHSGELILGPLQGHTDQISSVAHSPSGTQIASGSYDSTIRLWNSSTGLPIISPLEGHTKPVTSVAYSPDSAHIVSGSWDRTVRVWDMQSGALVAGPFNGHEATVSSVAYSPDGTRIISGSLDSTIRLWNAQDGTLIADPFQTHGDFIQSVAFSPDGSSFVSSSSKPAIRVWDLTKIGAHVTTDDAHDPASAESPPSNEAPDPTSTPTAPASALVQSSSTSNLQSLLRLWKIQSDGWVVNNDKLLFWVPPDIASYLPTIYNPFVIAPFGTLRIDYDNLLLGKDWHNCYQL